MNREDELQGIIDFQIEEIRKLQEKIKRVEQLEEHYKSIGFNDTAKRIKKTLKA